MFFFPLSLPSPSRLIGLAACSVQNGRPKTENQLTQPFAVTESKNTKQTPSRMFVFWKGRSCLLLKTRSVSLPFYLHQRPTTDVLEVSVCISLQKPLFSALPTHLLKCQQYLDCAKTNIIMNNRRKSAPKSGKPSTASSGRKSTFSDDYSYSQEESEVSDFEDELADYAPSFRGKGGKNSKKLSAQDFLRDQPVTRNKSKNLKIKIKTEPVSPSKEVVSAEANGSVAEISNSKKLKTKPRVHFAEDLSGSPSTSSGPQPGSQPAAKSGAEDSLDITPPIRTSTPTPKSRPKPKFAEEDQDEPHLSATQDLATPAAPATPNRTPSKKLPGSPGTPTRTPSRESPKRSPKGPKSPGKGNMIDRLSQFKGFARKQASSNSIPEESGPYLDQDEDTEMSDATDSAFSQSKNLPTCNAPPPGSQPAPGEQGSEPSQRVEMACGQIYSPRNRGQVQVQNSNFCSETAFPALEYSQDSGYSQSASQASLSTSEASNAQPGTSSHFSPGFSGTVAAGAVGSDLTAASLPPPPVQAPQLPSAQRLSATGPLGLESPASSNVTELLSPTVKSRDEEVGEDGNHVLDQLNVFLDEEDMDEEERSNPHYIREASKLLEEENEEEGDGRNELVPAPPSFASPYTPNPDLLAHGTSTLLDNTMQETVNQQLPPPVQPLQVVQVTETVQARQQTTTVRDPVTGQTQVIQAQTIANINVLSNAERSADGRVVMDQAIAGSSQANLVYNPHAQAHHSGQQVVHGEGRPLLNPELARTGAWAEDEQMETDSNSRPASANLQSESAPSPSPSAATVVPADVDMAEEQAEAGSSDKGANQPAAATSGRSSSQNQLQLVTLAPGERPPPSRDPKSDQYEDRGLAQRDLDAHAMKLWKQEERLREADILFGTRDHIAHPTDRTRRFFTETGYRTDVTMNHVIAAIRNTPYRQASEVLLSAAGKPGPEQERALSLLLETAIKHNKVAKIQKQEGLRNSKGRRRTPEEAKAALEVRQIQDQLTKARREHKAAKAAKNPGNSGQTAKPSNPNPNPQPNQPKQPNPRPTPNPQPNSQTPPPPAATGGVAPSSSASSRASFAAALAAPPPPPPPVQPSSSSDEFGYGSGPKNKATNKQGTRTKSSDRGRGANSSHPGPSRSDSRQPRGQDRRRSGSRDDRSRSQGGRGRGRGQRDIRDYSNSRANSSRRDQSQGGRQPASDRLGRHADLGRDEP